MTPLTAPIMSAPPARPVYIVDDDSMIRRSLSFSLGSAGYAPRAFASGRDFVEAAASLAPGCVLLDVRMPDLDGFGVLNALGAELYERLVVIVMTGHGDVETAVRAMKQGARDFLEKPFTDATLTEILDAAFATLQVDCMAAAERRDAAARVSLLTARERQILQGLMKALPSKVLAHSLGISTRTVEMHRRNLIRRMGVKSSTEAVRVALRANVRTDC